MADSVQRQVARVLDELVDSGAERGIQVAAYHHGEQVVDAVAGVADPGTGRPVTSDTPFYNFSIGKGATATVAHLLVERGAFGYQTPVAELWPEFAAHDKHKVTVWHVLTHTAGVPGVPLETTVEDLCDWDTMCAAVADAELWWEPGTKTGYHAYTFGFLVGEIVRRATGLPISQVLADQVSGPLGVADELYLGVPAAQQYRLARLESEPGMLEMFANMPPDLPMFRAGPPALFPTAELGNRADVLGAVIPAGAKTSARAIARMYAALLGEVDGVRLLPARRLAEISAPAWSGTDEVFGNQASWALGYASGVPATEGVSDTVFGMAGGGGSWAGADTARGLAIAVTKNRLTMDFDAVNRIVGIVFDALGA
jgi:CubicO group peptidase (beta-lactamase class C family)